MLDPGFVQVFQKYMGRYNPAAFGITGGLACLVGDSSTQTCSHGAFCNRLLLFYQAAAEPVYNVQVTARPT